MKVIWSASVNFHQAVSPKPQ